MVVTSPRLLRQPATGDATSLGEIGRARIASASRDGQPRRCREPQARAVHGRRGANRSRNSGPSRCSPRDRPRGSHCAWRPAPARVPWNSCPGRKRFSCDLGADVRVASRRGSSATAEAPAWRRPLPRSGSGSSSDRSVFRRARHGHDAVDPPRHQTSGRTRLGT